MRPIRLGPVPRSKQLRSRLLLGASSTCTHSLRHPLATCRWSSSDSTGNAAAKKPYYLTTPIFYVNAAPHIGHLYTMVLADVFKRWQQLQGNQAFLCTGTDEHGMKIQRAAQKQQMDPKEFCDGNSIKFKDLAALGSISNDCFIRTTDPEHRAAVEQFWLHLKYKLPEQLGLYKGSHEGWYCVSDECFYPENLVEMRLEPQTGKKIMVSTETDNEVEWIKEETWFFPLSKYKGALLKFYDENPDWITPKYRMNEVRRWVENHLEDLSVTRPVSRLNWGISDPEDPSQTIYVWVDALVNYLTKAGYGAKWHAPNQDMGLWPADVQMLGKDIIRFHAIYWPAMLMALGLPLPKKLVCHNHWTMSDRKMSKSLGNVVSPTFAIQRWGTDPLRYFLIRGGNSDKDMSYSNALILNTYEKELQAGIGNLFMRVAQPKSGLWSVRRAVEEHGKGTYIPQPTDKYFAGLLPKLLESPGLFQMRMDDFDATAAVRVVADLLTETNRFFSDAKPWDIVKAAEPQQQTILNAVIFHAVEAVRISAILLQPIMPSKMTKLLDDLAVSPDRRTFAHAGLGKDLDYGAHETMDRPLNSERAFSTLFPPALGSKAKTSKAQKAVDKQAIAALAARVGPEVADSLWEVIQKEASAHVEEGASSSK